MNMFEQKANNEVEKNKRPFEVWLALENAKIELN